MVDERKATPKVWVVRADGGKETQNCVDGGFTGIGWNETGDLSDVADRTAIAELWAEIASEEDGPGARGQVVGVLTRFVHEMRVGDWVITPGSNSQQLHYGRIIGEYRHESNPSDNCPYLHRRDVRWRRKTLDRSELSAPFFNTLNSYLTVFNARHRAEFFARIGLASAVPARADTMSPQMDPHELAIESILQLKARDFELLTGHLFAAMGFEISVTQLTNDGGVDFDGVLRFSNIARISVVGQVKRYKRGRRVNRKAVVDLRGRIPNGAQGVFVTTSDYAKTARAEAEEPGFARVGLINGEQLVDLLTQHWSGIPEDFRTQLALKPGLVPA